MHNTVTWTGTEMAETTWTRIRSLLVMTCYTLVSVTTQSAESLMCLRASHSCWVVVLHWQSAVGVFKCPSYVTGILQTGSVKCYANILHLSQLLKWLKTHQLNLTLHSIYYKMELFTFCLIQHFLL